jgi:type I restriction enzyme S subunit
MSFGKPYIMKTKGCIHDGWLVLRDKNNIINQDFLYYLLGSDFIFRQFNSLASGTTVKNLNINLVKNLKIPLPPLKEQIRIAQILDKADEIRQKRKQAIKLTEELLKSTFLEMFGDPVINPKGWDIVTFTDIMVLKRGYDLPISDRVEGKYPVIASNSIVGYHNHYKVKGPGVITGRSGTIGKVMYFKDNYWPLNTTLYSGKLNGNNAIYLTYFLRFFNLERFVRGTGVPTLNRNLFHSELAPLPPIELQNKFSKFVEQTTKLKEKYIESSQESENLFNSLLQRAFKGEL